MVAVGDRRPHVVALIALDPDAALAAHPAIRAANDAAVKTGNGKLSRVEQIKRFTILPAFWEPAATNSRPP